MGCDIHMYYEIELQGKWTYYDWRKQYVVGQDEDGDVYDYERMFGDPLCIWRDYNLFAVLADVRNGRGFAGVRTGSGFVPISKPRGLPEDVSSEVKVADERWGDDGHSHSWCSLQELLDYDWDRITTLEGDVDEANYRIFKAEGNPSEWYGGVGGGGIKVVLNSDMERVLAGDRELGVEYYTRVSWEVTYRQAIGVGWFDALNTLRVLRERLGAREIRLVFWFDN